MPLADTQAIAFMLSRPPSTIRSWACRGDLQRHGTDPHGRTLYDVDEALALAATRATLDNTSTRRNTQLPAGPVRPRPGDGALTMSGGCHARTRTLARHHRPARLRRISCCPAQAPRCRPSL